MKERLLLGGLALAFAVVSVWSGFNGDGPMCLLALLCAVALGSVLMEDCRGC